MGDETPAEITRCVRINGGMSPSGGHGQWVIDDVRTVDGVEMIQLVKRDFGFSRFVTGVSKGLTKLTFLDELRQMRTQATIAACNDGLFDAPTSDPRVFAQQKRKWSSDGIPAVVEVQLPAISTHESRKVKVQGNLHAGERVWVELNGVVLDHIACCMRASFKEDGGSRVVLGNGVRWSKGRNCYIARRCTKRMKFFRPNADDSDEDAGWARAKSKALAWANGEDDDDDDDDGDANDAEQDEEDDEA